MSNNHTGIVKVLALTREDAILLKEHYEIAVKNGDKQFKFKSRMWVTDYAKYVIEYLTDKFNLDK